MFDGRDAEETKEWDRFWCSGRVEDYLSFKNCQESRTDCGQESRENAGFFTGDGDRTEIRSRG